MASTTCSGRFNFKPKMCDLFRASSSSSSKPAASSELKVSSPVVATIEKILFKNFVCVYGCSSLTYCHGKRNTPIQNALVTKMGGGLVIAETMYRRG